MLHSHLTLSTKCADIRNNVAIIGGILFLPFNFKKIDIKISIDKISNPRNKFFGILNGENENIKNNITTKYLKNVNKSIIIYKYKIICHLYILLNQQMDQHI